MKHNNNVLLTCAALIASAAAGNAQSYRRAALIRASDPYEGRCTVSVLVDGAADVEIRGDNASLRRVSGGAPPRWERFECTGPLPNSAANLRLRAVEGNGRMALTHDSYNGGVAVVHMANSDFGDQLYTFDVFWRPERVYQSTDADRMIIDDDSVQSCRTAAENRIRDDGYRDIRFGSVSKEMRGANDLVMGTASASRTYGPESFSFSCRVDPDDGHVRRLDLTRR
jgi:hypothetical protein